MRGLPSLFVVGYGAPQRLLGRRVEVLPGQSAQASHARVVAGWFDLVCDVKDERERPHPRPPRRVGPDRPKNLLVIDAKLAPRQLGGHRPVQQLRALPFLISHLKVPFLGQVEEFLASYLAGCVVQQSGQAYPISLQIVGQRQILGRVGHPQGVFVTLLREPGTGEGFGSCEESVRFRVVLHPTDCRIPACAMGKTYRAPSSEPWVPRCSSGTS